MPYVICKQLGLVEQKSTKMRFLMEVRSMKHPMGILYHFLVKVDRLVLFPADFIILDHGIDA